MHDIVTVGVPLIAILAGVLFNRSDLHGEFTGLRAEMNNRFNKVEDHLSRMAADLRQFYHLTGKLEGRVEALEKRG